MKSAVSFPKAPQQCLFTVAHAIAAAAAAHAGVRAIARQDDTAAMVVRTSSVFSQPQSTDDMAKRSDASLRSAAAGPHVVPSIVPMNAAALVLTGTISFVSQEPSEYTVFDATKHDASSRVNSRSGSSICDASGGSVAGSRNLTVSVIAAASAFVDSPAGMQRKNLPAIESRGPSPGEDKARVSDAAISCIDGVISSTCPTRGYHVDPRKSSCSLDIDSQADFSTVSTSRNVSGRAPRTASAT